MKTLRDKLWIWGQSPDIHWIDDNVYRLPGHSRMTPMEGAIYFDIPNMCRIRMSGMPKAPFDQEQLVLEGCQEVVWSLLGAEGEEITEWGDLEEVARQARKYENITGGVFDDFFSPARMRTFTPERLRHVKNRLSELAGRNMDTWVVCYEIKFDIPNLAEYLNSFDVITFWTWNGSALVDLEKNLDHVRSLAPDKRLLAGCYMWNYGEACPLTVEQMKLQTDIYLEYLKKGKIDGIVVCSNCIGDLDIEAVYWMKNWIREHKDIVVEG